MSGLGTFFARRRWKPIVAAAYAAVLLGIFYTLAQFHIPDQGFTYLLAFGERLEDMRLPVMRELEYHVLPDSDGYDAQYYVQIAMDPLLRDAELARAMDSLPYRARRILFSWTAYAFGFGQPAWILNAYALQGAAAWLALALLLLHWFPPRSWNDFLRWGGVLCSFGMCISLRYALIDGPSLLLVASGVWAVERNRPWLATGVFAFAGLGKETSILGAAALVKPDTRDPRVWLRRALQGVLVLAPLVLWLAYIQLHVVPAADIGARNFDWPFVAWGRKWIVVLQQLSGRDASAEGAAPSLAIGSLLMLVALTVQFLFFVLRPRPQEAWWRVAASFAVLMLVLGDAVWEGYPGAASRVLLPMQLAFNVLVPRGRAWIVVLVLGNLTLISAPPTLEPPGKPGFEFEGPESLLVAASGTRPVVTFAGPWHEAERKGGGGTRKWSSGDATISVVNPHPFAVRAHLTFGLNSVDARTVRLLRGAAEIWRGSVDADVVSVEVGPLELAPGENQLAFFTDKPAAPAPGRDPRALAFCVHDLRIRLLAP